MPARPGRHIGLKETHHIGRIVVHPTDPNIVYVAALGDLWGPNKERGVYRSTDGGATWTLTLAINEDTGVSDIAIDPQSPNIFYAAAYQRRRTVFAITAAALTAEFIGASTVVRTGPSSPRDFPPPGTSAAALSTFIARTATSSTPWWST